MSEPARRPKYPRPSRTVDLDLAKMRELRLAAKHDFSSLGRALASPDRPKGYSNAHVNCVERGVQGASPEFVRALARVLLDDEDRYPELLRE